MRGIGIILLLCVFCASAQQSPIPLRFQNITTEQGLPHNFTHSVTQDSTGFIWIGTNYGLARYDGYTFKVFIPDVNNPHSITHKPIGTTFIDSDNNLWLSINSGGINKMDLRTEQFTGYFTDKTKKYFLAGDNKRFYEDEEKRLWVITTSGVFLYNKENDEFTYVFSDDRFYRNPLLTTNYADDGFGKIWFVCDGVLFILNKNTLAVHEFNEFSTNPEYLTYYYNTVISHQKGIIWLLSYNNGLIHFDLQNKKSTVILQNILNLRDIFIDKKGNVYVLSYDRNKLDLHVLKDGDLKLKNFSTYSLPEVELQNFNFHFVEDNYGKVYISGGCGISIFDSNTWSITHSNTNQIQDNGLIDNSIRNLFIDRTDNLWLCVNRKGINKADLRQKPFRLYENEINSESNSRQQAMGLIAKDKTVTSVFEDSKGNLWVGGSDYGVTVYNKDRSKSIRYYLNSILPILSIQEDIDGTFLLGTYMSTIYRVYAPNLDKLKANASGNFNVIQTYNTISVRKIIVDRSTNLWFASGDGLVEWNRNNNEFTNYSALYDSLNFLSTFYRTVFITRDQIIWTGSNYGGLCKFDKSGLSFKHYLHDPDNPKSISNNTVYAIYEDPNGFLWVGTGQGLEKFNPKDETFERASLVNALFNRSVFSVLPDEQGNFWMSTEKGIFKYNPKNKQIEAFGQADGIKYNEYSTTASYKNRSDELFFGGSVGLVSFLPEQLNPNTIAARPVITNFLFKNRIVSPGDSINGRVLIEKQISKTKEITLSYKEADFTLEFSALHYSAPEKNSYQYKLEGFSSDWVYTDAKKRYATYTGLPPGKYTFILRASNNDGLMCSPQDEARLSITIVPPFWQTVWFKIIVLLATTVLVFLFVGYRVRSLKKLNILLDQKVTERTHALEEANVYLEESQEEISQQKEEILAQFEALEEHQKIIIDQNSELFSHRNKLESLVEERTRELEMALEKAEESDKLKTSFLTNMSHEIRTPMNAIVGFSSLLTEENDTKKRKKFNDIIKTNGVTLMSLINDILDLSRIQALQVSLFPKKANLYDLMIKLYETFKIDTDKKNITLTLSISPINGHFKMWFDEIRLKQVLTNLLSNAIKFTSSGEVEFGIIKVSAVITFFVRDTGIGIPQGAGEAIFDRFYKIEDNKSHLFRGTGLGLAISKSLVLLWNGHIWFESEYGRGTTFFFTHPLNEAEIEEYHEIQSIKNSTIDLKGRRILIAEDEESNFLLLEGFLDKTEAEIIWAKDGLEAVVFASKSTCDIVLMDIKMPKMDGIKASKEIKKIHPLLPIIAQTAYAFPDEIENILLSGIDDYISKPIDRDDLFDLIQKYLK
jgi:signal transduction histidine kinase/ligand-binding sensor domain-containing protein/CheY-like chemotaxis protein